MIPRIDEGAGGFRKVSFAGETDVVGSGKRWGDAFFVPEGRRGKSAGGKTAPADAAPGYRGERTMPQRGIEEITTASQSRTGSPERALTRGNNRLPGLRTDAANIGKPAPFSPMPRWGKLQSRPLTGGRAR